MMQRQDAPRIVYKRRRPAHGGPHRGGAWKVAYADFVTAMMALFMVLWLLTQADVELRSEIAQYFRDPGILPGARVLTPNDSAAQSREPKVAADDVMIVHTGELDDTDLRVGDEPHVEQERLEAQAQAIEAAVEEAAALDPRFQALRDQVLIEVGPSGLLIQVVDRALSKDLLFDLSSSELKAPLVALLRRIGALLGQLPNPVRIGGHTDARPFRDGSGRTNWDLSFARADNARRVLLDGGLRAHQLDAVLAYADRLPLRPDAPLADENRRLSILAVRSSDASRPEPLDEPIILPTNQLPEGDSDA